MTNDYRLKAMTEAQLQDAIVELAQRTGWTVDFVPDWVWRLAFNAMKEKRRGDRQWSPPGKPDLLMVRPGRLIFAELKSTNGSLRKPQRDWIELLKTVEGVETYVWKPRHWLSGEIDEVLI